MMRKKKLSILALLVCCVLAACNVDEGSMPPNSTVISENENGGADASGTKVPETDQSETAPEEPSVPDNVPVETDPAGVEETEPHQGDSSSGGGTQIGDLW